jgi:hypothetical protein
LFIALGIGSVFMLSPYFGTHVARDVFAGRPQNITVKKALLQPLLEIPITDYGVPLRLSTDGQWFAYGMHDTTKAAKVERFKVMATDGSQQVLPANDLHFVDENHLLSLSYSQETSNLSLWAKQGNDWRAQKQWQLPPMGTGTLQTNKQNGLWRVVGQVNGNETTLLITGAVNEEEFAAQKFPTFQGEFSYQGTVLGNGILERHKDSVYRFLATGSHTSFYFNDGEKRVKVASSSRTRISCLSPLPGEELDRIPCLSIDIGASLLTFLNLENDRSAPVFRIPDYLYFRNSFRQGNRLYFTDGRGEFYVVDMASQQATTFQLPDKPGFIGFAVAEPQLAVTTRDEQNRYFIRVYKLP